MKITEEKTTAADFLPPGHFRTWNRQEDPRPGGASGMGVLLMVEEMY